MNDNIKNSIVFYLNKKESSDNDKQRQCADCFSLFKLSQRACPDCGWDSGKMTYEKIFNLEKK